MNKLIMLKGEDFQLNNYISIHFPTLGEISALDESLYLDSIYKFCSTPSDHKVMLDDMKIDYSKLDDWEMFLIMHQQQLFSDDDKKAFKLVMGDFDITNFDIGTRPEFNDVVLAFEEKIFDRAVYLKLTALLREMHNFTRRVDRPGNEHTRHYLIEKERRQLKRRKHKKNTSRYYPLIVALINTPEFKYDYQTVWDLTIYQFNRSIRHIQKVKEFGFIMNGIYSGTIDSSKLNMETIHWLKD